MEEITIHVFIDSEGNYQFNVYDCAPEDVGANRPIDGGTCEMNMSTAIGMSVDRAKSFLRRFRQ